MKFYIIDAFTDKIFGGNPAGVVFVPDGVDFPDEAIMRKTAAELRYSETVFVKRVSEHEYSLRYFTVTDEVELCGHATIAAFSVIFAEPDAARRLTATTKAGKLAVENDGGLIFLDMAQPTDISLIDDEANLKEVYACVGLELGGAVAGWLPEVISTGLPDIILPVSSKEVLNAMKPDFPMMAALSEKMDVTGVHAFALVDAADGDGVTVHCRNFAPLYGIDEEAATGTANGALTWYLYKKGVVRDLVRYVQGEAMGRASAVYGKVSFGETGQAGRAEVMGNAAKRAQTAQALRIQIGGRCALLAAGEIFV